MRNSAWKSATKLAAWAIVMLAAACQAANPPSGGGTTAGPICGNGLCEGVEPGYCPQDCKAGCAAPCSAAVCTAAGEIQDCITDGNGCKVLAAPKACANGNPCTAGACAGAASSPTCGDGQCVAGESAQSCPADCATAGPPCGDGKCEPGESTASCAADCPAGCQPSCDEIQCDDGCGGGCDGHGCDDGKACTSETQCKNGSCMAGKVKDCDDDNACTSDGCDAAGNCTHAPGAFSGCSDGNPCTTGDKCSGGKCIGLGTASCDDGDPCTADACKVGQGCTNTSAADGTSCGGSGICVAGGCCTCAAGQYCNASGTCVSANSCKGKCGQYDKPATCQCDDECTKYGDCCADYSAVCSSCTPGAFANCCDSGKALCQFDSCGKEETTKKQACAFGCAPAKPGELLDKCKDDPCFGIGSSGECITPGMVAYCSVTTGDSSAPALEFLACDKWEVCDDSMGFAWCGPGPTACETGATQCVAGSANVAKTCVDGAWQQVPCSKCSPTSIGGQVACPGPIALVPASGKVKFEYIYALPGYTGYALDNPIEVPVIKGLVFSIRFSDDYSESTVLDVASTADDGSTTIKIPQIPNPTTDFVVLVASGYNAAIQKVQYTVAEPKVGDGEISVQDELAGQPYSWMVGASAFKSTGSWTIGINEKSFALQVYDAIRYTYENTKLSLFGQPGKTLVAWVRDGTDWSCGACFWGNGPAAPVGGMQPQSQLWIGSSNLTYWSNAVLYHEVGHWVMDSYGSSPNEGGTHFVGTKVPAGMAWSEGWATFFSSMARGDGVYYDQGGNGMWWVDLGKVKYDSGGSLLPFNANAPLAQFMDENRVASTLWNSAVKSAEPFKEPGNQGFWKALTSNQMNTPPYTRPYNRQVWESVTPGTGGDLNATYTGLKQTKTPATTLPSYLDALLCAAPQLKSAVAAAIAPLPFPVNTPICKP